MVVVGARGVTFLMIGTLSLCAGALGIREWNARWDDAGAAISAGAALSAGAAKAAEPGLLDATGALRQRER